MEREIAGYSSDKRATEFCGGRWPRQLGKLLQYLCLTFLTYRILRSKQIQRAWRRCCGRKQCGWDDGMKTLRSVGEGRHVKQPAGNRFADQRVEVCETRDLGIGFPSWHARPFEEGVIVDMKVESARCEEDTQRSRERGSGKRWDTRNESDVLKKEGVWVEPLKALLRKKPTTGARPNMSMLPAHCRRSWTQKKCTR